MFHSRFQSKFHSRFHSRFQSRIYSRFYSRIKLIFRLVMILNIGTSHNMYFPDLLLLYFLTDLKLKSIYFGYNFQNRYAARTGRGDGKTDTCGKRGGPKNMKSFRTCFIGFHSQFQSRF